MPVEVSSRYVMPSKDTLHCRNRYQIINKRSALHPGFFSTCFCILGGKSTVCCCHPECLALKVLEKEVNGFRGGCGGRWWPVHALCTFPAPSSEGMAQQLCSWGTMLVVHLQSLCLLPLLQVLSCSGCCGCQHRGKQSTPLCPHMEQGRGLIQR